MKVVVNDGLDALRAEIGLPEIASIIERTARWVDPATFKLLPIWFPEHARGCKFYKGGWSEPQMNTRRSSGTTSHKVEGNIYANQALTLALGLRKANRPNWSCCHIWGIDDATYQASNQIVQDRKFYSCIGNMVLLPTPLKAFTDTMPEIKTMLRLCARYLYGWHCDHEGLTAIHNALDNWTAWDAYPASWPRTLNEKIPLGTVKLTPAIQASATERLSTIRNDLKQAGPFYPRKDVLEVLKYWKIPVEQDTEAPSRSTTKNDSSRFAGTSDDVVPLGKTIHVVDHLTDEDREDNAKHDIMLKEIFKLN